MGSFYEELEHALHQFPKYNMNILLDFTAYLGRKANFKLTTRNDSLHEMNMIMGLKRQTLRYQNI